MHTGVQLPQGTKVSAESRDRLRRERKEMGTKSNFVLSAAAGVVAVASVGTAAWAGGKTNVQNAPGGELGHHAIVQGIYGGAFSGSPAAGFNRAGPNSLTLLRVDDLGSDILDLAGSNMGTASDKVWHDGVISMTAKARYAGYSQVFGMFAGETAGAPFIPLINVGGSGMGVTGELANFDIGAISHTWRWGRAGDGSTFSSRDSDNPDGLDHMVSYKVEGLDNGFDATWLLFFEDLRSNQNSDWDYNDLVIEIHVMARGQVVPMPTAVNLGVAGLLGLAGVRRRRA